MTAATSPAVGLSPPTAARPQARAQGLDRIGFWAAIAFATILGAARLIDVSEDGPAMLLFGMAFTAAVAVTSVLRPKWFPLLAAAYLPFSRVYSVGLLGVPGANMINILIVLGVVACVTSYQMRRRRIRLGRAGRLVVLYMLVGSLSMVSTFAAGNGVGEVIQLYRSWVSPILFFLAALLLVRDRQGVVDIIHVIAWTTMLVSGLTWMEGLGREGRGTIDASRVPGLMRQANSMGAFLVYYGVPLLALGLTTRSWPRRLLYFAGYLVAARAMLFTFSRGAYLAIAAGSALVLLLRSPMLLLAGLGGGVMTVAAVPSLIPSSVTERLSETTSEERGVYSSSTVENLDRSSAHRLLLWRGAARMIATHPLQGVGIGLFQPMIGLYTEVPLRPDDPSDAHNAFILTAAEMGLPTLAVQLLLHATFAAMALQLYFRRRLLVDRTLALAFLGCQAGVLVSCMLGSRFSDESLIAYFWLMAGLLAAVSALREPLPPPRRRRRPAWR